MGATYLFESIKGFQDYRQIRGETIALNERNDDEALRLAKEHCKKHDLSYAQVSYYDKEEQEPVFIATVRPS